MRKRNKLVFGVGVNDADYVIGGVDAVTGKHVICPYYQKWTNMLERCYSTKYKEKHPTYKGCIVCEEWLTFSNFKTWMQDQDWEGKQLDKDLLNSENKEYNPNTCVFVDRLLNTFVVDCGKSRGDHLIGVCSHKHTERFISQCRNPLTKKKENLGYFTTELEAHLAWKARKLELVDLLQEQGYIIDSCIYEALKLKYK